MEGLVVEIDWVVKVYGSGDVVYVYVVDVFVYVLVVVVKLIEWGWFYVVFFEWLVYYGVEVDWGVNVVLVLLEVFVLGVGLEFGGWS